MRRKRFRHWFDNNIERWPDFLGVLMLGIGLIVFLSEYFGWSTFHIPVLSDLLLRVWPELIGIGLAVIIIDNANELLRTREEKKRLILQMGSPTNDYSLEAVRQLRSRGWLSDGSLVNAYLGYSNLEGAFLADANLNGAFLQDAILVNANLRYTNMVGAILSDANLERAYLYKANLCGAQLDETNLEKANLSEVNLERADLWGANLEGANLTEANLEGANLTDANLEGAKVKPVQLDEAASLEDATMPDGTVYNPETFKDSLEEQEPPE